ncbi:MAG TPA: O-antigen ligase family protein [Pyrinomonadaceae bacterium]
MRFARRVGLAGLTLYAVFAPHSIAGAWIGLALAFTGWLYWSFSTLRLHVRRTPLDLPFWLLFAWSVLSALLSAEPRISLLKLASVGTFLVYYCAQALLTHRTAVWLAGLLILSGCAGAARSVFETARGRGVVVAQLTADSPLRAVGLRPGDAVWRVNGRAVNSPTELAAALRAAPADRPLRLSVITQGEHVEWPAPALAPAQRDAEPPAGLYGGARTRRFRASGWTRHYETFAEVLQIIAQLALGLALAHWQRRAHAQRQAQRQARTRLLVGLYAAAFVLLAAGLALTAMRTVLVAFVVGATVVLWRGAASGRARALALCAVALVCALGALAVWRTRAAGALRLQDPSAQLRLAVARHAAARVPLHPVFGHGMDAVHRHWQEWGFPGTDMLHAHSTPVQLAFDRGLPAVFLWLWLMLAFWRTTTRAERAGRPDADAAAHGLLLGASGALAGLFASALVNYNFGDAEVTLLLWWLMGAVVRVNAERETTHAEQR